MVVPITCTDSAYHRDSIQGKPLLARIYLKLCWRIAIKLHLGQDRRIGGRAVEHPMVTSVLVQDFGLGVFSQAASLFHDGIEDQKGLRKFLAGLLIFIGNPIVFILVVALTNWFGDDKRRYFRWILWISRIFWVILVIKLADRFHNETCPYGGDPDRARMKHTETLRRCLPACRFGRRYIPAKYLPRYDVWFNEVRALARQNLYELDHPSH